jgi:UDP-4-amino-4,6-dideoxy-N-acetyl-beta-L-altrosamine N-acetyltransferase
MNKGIARRFTFAGIDCVPFHELSKDDLLTILTWRNDDRVRCLMVNDVEISLDEHLRFVEQLRRNSTAAYFGVFVDSQLSGVINITKIDTNTETGEWGYYGAPDNADNMLALRMIKAVEHYFFQVLQGRVLSCIVKENNSRALRIVEAMKYERVSKSKGILFFEKRMQRA